MKKQLIISAIVLAVVGAGALGTTQALAQTNGQESLVQMLSDKFHLNKADVQTVFDEHRSTQMQKHQQKFNDRLTQAVKDGKLTDAQKTLIENKLKEFASNRQSDMGKLKDMTPTERKAEMEKQKQAINDWAKQNGIDPTYLMPGRGMGMKMHMMGR